MRVHRADGEPVLLRRRGRACGKAHATVDSARPRDEIEQLKRRVQWLEMENAYLKALRDFNDAHE